MECACSISAVRRENSFSLIGLKGMDIMREFVPFAGIGLFVTVIAFIVGLGVVAAILP